MIITLAKNQESLRKYDLSCIKTIWTGAAPLAKEIALVIQEQHPTWRILQGYGLTETCTLVTSSAPHDQWLGSSGSLLPGMTARLVDVDGREVTQRDTPGELYIYSISNALGYFNNEVATRESFPDGWMRTGDEAMFRRGPNGHDHIFIVDRIKELIKVKVRTAAAHSINIARANSFSIRDTRLRQPSLKLDCSPVRKSQTLLLSRSRMRLRESYQRLSW